MASHQSLSSMLALMASFREELDYAVLSNLISVIDYYFIDHFLCISVVSPKLTVFRYFMQISYKVSKIAADAVPDLQNHIKLFFINLFQCSAEYVTGFLEV